MTRNVFRFSATAGQSQSRGFTLIEVIIACAIIAILAAITLPSYSYQVRKSRRTDAKTALLDLAARQEKYYATRNTYTANAAALGYPALPLNVPGTGTADYTLTVTAATTSTFTATATPIGPQATDECGTYGIDQTGTQTITGTTTAVAQCW